MRSQLLAALVAVAALAGCGGDDTQSTTEKQQPVVAGTDLTPVKDYLLDHTARLQDDYAKLLAAHRAEVASLVKDMQATYIAANPAYEEMEGVVAGVPSLADYDVIIDAVPDADFLLAATRDFAANAKDLDAAAKAWDPTAQDAFTALVVMTPTMSEYFEA